MSDVPFYNIDKIPTVDEVKTKAQNAYNDAPPEVKQAVEQSKSFYESNKTAIHATLVGLVVLRIYRRKITKSVSKVITKAIAETPVTIDVDRYMDDYKAWCRTYQEIV